MTVYVKKEPLNDIIIKREEGVASRKIVIHPSVVSAYILETAAKKVQKYMAISGKALFADKLGVLLCNLRLLAKTPRRFSRTIGSLAGVEFYDSTSVRGISGAIEAAMTLLPHMPEVDFVLRVLGRFSSIEDCAIAPKGTRAQLGLLINTFIKTHKTEK
jgi:hypothetical protein